MKINFSDPRLFTKSFWKIQRALKEHTRFKLIYGGSGSSKSYSYYQTLAIQFLQEKQHDFLVLRKYGTTIEHSIFNGIKHIIQSWELAQYFEFSKRPYVIVNKLTGRKMIMLGVDDPEKLKSIVNIKYALLEEATDFSFEDFKEINRRLRGIPGIQIGLCFNPISHTHWIKKHFFDTFEVNVFCSFVHCHYTDNHFLTKEDIEQLEQLKTIDENDYRVYVLGQWGVLTERLIFKNFTEVDHIPKEAKMLPCGLDFGFNPDPCSVSEKYLLGRDLYLNELIYETGLVNVLNPETPSIQERLESINFDKYRCIVADSAEPKSIQELRNAGFNVYGFRKYPGSIKDGLKKLKSYRIHITKTSRNIINEFENYVHKIDKDGNILPEPIDSYNHCIDESRYVILMEGRFW